MNDESHTDGARVGRPKASSPETLADAACELFLERGYHSTSIADIAGRAGVSRSSFFNYFSSKSAILWAGLDERIQAMVTEWNSAHGPNLAADIAGVVRAELGGFRPDSLALAMVHGAAMGVESELARDSAIRQHTVARAVRDRAERAGLDPIDAAVLGGATGAAVLAAVEVWAREPAPGESLAEVSARAIAVALHAWA